LCPPASSRAAVTRTTAPTVAAARLATKPYAWIPSWRNIQPPITAPISPRNKSASSPNPPPRVILPLSQPAIKPTTIHPSKERGIVSQYIIPPGVSILTLSRTRGRALHPEDLTITGFFGVVLSFFMKSQSFLSPSLTITESLDASPRGRGTFHPEDVQVGSRVRGAGYRLQGRLNRPIVQSGGKALPLRNPSPVTCNPQPVPVPSAAACRELLNLGVGTVTQGHQFGEVLTALRARNIWCSWAFSASSRLTRFPMKLLQVRDCAT